MWCTDIHLRFEHLPAMLSLVLRYRSLEVGKEYCKSAHDAGGQGFADVAVSAVRQQEAAEPTPATPDLEHLSLADGPDGSDGGRKKGKLLARVAAGAAGVAAQLAKGAQSFFLYLFPGDENKDPHTRSGATLPIT